MPSFDPEERYLHHRSYCNRNPGYCSTCQNLRAAVNSWEAQQKAARAATVTVHDETGDAVEVPRAQVPADLLDDLEER